MRRYTAFVCLGMLAISLSGCGLMEDAFKAGLFFALVLVAIIALIIWLARVIGKQLTKKYDLTWEEDEINVPKTH